MLALRWFASNYMKLSTNKSYVIVSCWKHEQVWTNIREHLIWKSNDIKLLRRT